MTNISSFSGTACFFVKYFKWTYTRGGCINDTGRIQSNGSWGSLSFITLTHDSCLDPSAQFRFRDNGAMLNLQRQGCLAAFNRSGYGYDLDMFYLYVDSASLDRDACAQKPKQGIYRAITQTSEGGLSVYYKGKGKTSFQTWCAKYKSDRQLSIILDSYQSNRVRYYLGLTTRCKSISSNQKFIFG